MVLTKQEQKLFFPTVNGLIERAGVTLIGRGELPMPDTPEEDQATTQRVLERLWSDGAFLDGLVADWPELTARQRELIGTWHQAHRAHYLVTFRGTQAYFLADGYAFAVSGLEKPIDDLVNNAPAFVETTLLPFGDKIVYDTMLFEYPVAAMPNMKKLIEDDLDRLIGEGKLLRTGDELVKLEPAIKAQAAERENDRVVREAEELLHADEVPEGFHKGELAGLEGDAREGALLRDDEEASLKRIIAEVQFDDLLANAEPGRPEHGLARLLALGTKDSLQRYAKAMGLHGYSKLRKQELAEFLADSLSSRREIIGAMLDTLPPAQIDSLRAIADAGGTLVVKREKLDPDMQLPEPRPFLCYAFADAGDLVLVIPDEVMALADEIDWEDSREYSRNSQIALDFAEAVVRLRGAVYIVDLAFEYQKRYPDGLELPEFVTVVMRAVEDELISCELLVPQDRSDDFEESYLLDYSLASVFRHEANIVTSSPILTAKVGGTFVGEILHERDKVEPRPLMQSVSSPFELDDWILARPAVNALVRYLDGHVPDGQPDRAFADNVMMDLIPYMQMGFRSARTVNGYLDILEDHGFVPAQRMLNQLLDLLMNAANAVPQWPNNGWSANELRDRELAESGTGTKVFYDENGRPMKVGRNDPCPCGSGKKYKNCHGKRH